MSIRRMTIGELARASWLFFMWCAFLGANAGCLIGELLAQRRWEFIAMGVAGTACSWLALRSESAKSRKRIYAFYDAQLAKERAR